ncbi:ABC transporter ATP-binding protein [Aliihoeflea sp. PC F10.4]
MMDQPKVAGSAIRIDNVSKTYGTFVALKDVSLDIRPGEFMSFLGPSGSGKTTTLNMIAGFTDNDQGSIQMGERALDKVPAHKRNIGVVFQHYALFPHMTVAANVAYPLRQRSVPRRERDLAVTEVLKKVKLDAFSHRYPSELSGGQQQRVALARAMVFAPSVLLMDEPLGALDKKLRETLQLEIKRIHRELGSTFVYVTHDQEEALVLSDRIAVFNKGRIEQVGTGRDLYERPETLFVGKFIGESSVLRGPCQVKDGRARMTVCGHEILSDMCPANEGPHALLLRPEDVTVKPIGSTETAFDNILKGRVRELIYVGSATKFEIVLADGTVMLARGRSQDSGIAHGDEVEICWSASSGSILRDEADA